MGVPAVALSTLRGALSGYALTRRRFKYDMLVFGLTGSGRLDAWPGAGPFGPRNRLHHFVLSQPLSGFPDRTGASRLNRRRRVPRHLPAHFAAEFRADYHDQRDLAVHQYLE